MKVVCLGVGNGYHANFTIRWGNDFFETSLKVGHNGLAKGIYRNKEGMKTHKKSIPYNGGRRTRRL